MSDDVSEGCSVLFVLSVIRRLNNVPKQHVISRDKALWKEKALTHLRHTPSGLGFQCVGRSPGLQNKGFGLYTSAPSHLFKKKDSGTQKLSGHGRGGGCASEFDALTSPAYRIPSSPVL